MKKMIVLVLAAAMALNMAACGGKDKEEPEAEVKTEEKKENKKSEKWDVDFSDTTEVEFSFIYEGADEDPDYEHLIPLAKVKIPDHAYLLNVDDGTDQFGISDGFEWNYEEDNNEERISINEFLKKVEDKDVIMPSVNKIQFTSVESEKNGQDEDDITVCIDVYAEAFDVEKTAEFLSGDVKTEGNFVRAYESDKMRGHYIAYYALPELSHSVRELEDAIYPVLYVDAYLPVEEEKEIDYCTVLDDWCMDMVEPVDAAEASGENDPTEAALDETIQFYRGCEGVADVTLGILNTETNDEVDAVCKVKVPYTNASLYASGTTPENEYSTAAFESGSIYPAYLKGDLDGYKINELNISNDDALLAITVGEYTYDMYQEDHGDFFQVDVSHVNAYAEVLESQSGRMELFIQIDDEHGIDVKYYDRSVKEIPAEELAATICNLFTF